MEGFDYHHPRDRYTIETTSSLLNQTPSNLDFYCHLIATFRVSRVRFRLNRSPCKRSRVSPRCGWDSKYSEGRGSHSFPSRMPVSLLKPVQALPSTSGSGVKSSRLSPVAIDTCRSLPFYFPSYEGKCLFQLDCFSRPPRSS